MVGTPFAEAELPASVDGCLQSIRRRGDTRIAAAVSLQQSQNFSKGGNMEEVSCPVATAPKKGGGGKKRFELKKWQAVAMWTWGGSPPAPPALPPRAGAPPRYGRGRLAAAGDVDHRRGLTGGGAPPTTSIDTR